MEAIEINSPHYPEGEKHVARAGKEGRIKVTYKDGQVVSRQVVEEMVPEIIHVGFELDPTQRIDHNYSFKPISVTFQRL